MLTQLSQRFDLLVSRRKDLPARHSSLHNVIAWSYQRLDPDLQTFFARCSVFQGGWTLDAAVQVCDEPNALGMLRKLREHSLIVVEEQGEEMRYRLLETLREFGDAQLSEDERTSLEELHADYFRQLAKKALDYIAEHDQRPWLDRLEADHDNLRLALDRARQHGTALNFLQFCLDLSGFWNMRSHYQEAERHFLMATEQYVEPDAWRASGLHRVAIFLTGPTLERQRACLQESLAIYKRLDNRQGAFYVLLGLFDRNTPYEGGPAYHYLEEALQWLPANSPGSQADVLHKLGVFALSTGELETARSRFTQALELRRGLGGRRSIGLSLLNLGLAQFELEGWQAGKPSLEEAFGLFQEIGYRFGQAVVAALAWTGCLWFGGCRRGLSPDASSAHDATRTGTARLYLSGPERSGRPLAAASANDRRHGNSIT